MQTQYLDVDNYRIRYAHSSKAGAPSIVFLSPLPQSILAYQDVWDALAPHFNLYAIDLPGFGGSQGSPEMMEPYAQAKMLKKIMQLLQIRETHIVAPDVGTPVAFAYLAQSKNASFGATPSDSDSPKVLSLLVGDGPAVYPPSVGPVILRMMRSPFWRWLYGQNAKMFVQAGNRAGYVRYKPKDAEVADYIVSYQNRLKPVMQWFANYDEVLPKIDASLSGVDIPVKIFWGDKDSIVLPQSAQQLEQKLPRSEVQIFENTGHFSYQDAAPEFAKMVQDWVLGGYQRL